VPYRWKTSPGCMGIVCSASGRPPVMPGRTPSVDGEIRRRGGAILEVIQARYGDGQWCRRSRRYDLRCTNSGCTSPSVRRSRFFRQPVRRAQGAGVKPRGPKRRLAKGLRHRGTAAGGIDGVSTYMRTTSGGPVIGAPSSAWPTYDALDHTFRPARGRVYIEDYPHLSLAGRGRGPTASEGVGETTPTGTGRYGLPLLASTEPVIQMMPEAPAR